MYCVRLNAISLCDTPHLVATEDGEKILALVRNALPLATPENPVAVDVGFSETLTGSFLSAILLPFYLEPDLDPQTIVFLTLSDTDEDLVAQVRNSAQHYASDPEAYDKAIAEVLEDLVGNSPQHEGSQHPNPRGLAGLIENVVNTITYTYDTAAGAEFDLSLSGIIVVPGRRTAAALAGWYALATWSNWDTLLTDDQGYVLYPIPQDTEDDGRLRIFTETREPILELHCADNFARALGFDDHFALQSWAAANPALWGNSYGEQMFHLPIAYNAQEQPTLEAVLNHWRAVARRLNKA